jgi:putative redox protein
MEAKVRWAKGMKFIAETDDQHSVVMDADSEFGGEDSGPRPIQLLLGVLGGCTGMDVVSILRKMRIGFDSLEIEVKAERTDQHPMVFTQIELKYVIIGDDIPEDKFAKAIELSHDRYCSVSAMLGKTADFTITRQIIRKDGR